MNSILIKSGKIYINIKMEPDISNNLHIQNQPHTYIQTHTLWIHIYIQKYINAPLQIHTHSQVPKHTRDIHTYIHAVTRWTVIHTQVGSNFVPLIYTYNHTYTHTQPHTHRPKSPKKHKQITRLCTEKKNTRILIWSYTAGQWHVIQVGLIWINLG